MSIFTSHVISRLATSRPHEQDEGLFRKSTLSPVLFFWLITLKGTAQCPAVDLFEADHLKRYPNRFLNSEAYSEHSIPFI